MLMREAAKTQTDAHPFTIVLLFCGVGLLACFGMVVLGLDLSAGIS
jgi:ABC-type transporter Mla subunit MlaD